MFESYEKLTPETIPEYLASLSLPAGVFSGDITRITDIGDGNLNNVFRIESATHSVVLKQSLTYLKCAGEDHALAVERMRYEIAYYDEVSKIVPKHVPDIYAQDDRVMMCIVMQDLKAHQVVRTGMLSSQKFPKLADHSGSALAKILFRTSRLALSLTEHETLVAKFSGNTLRDLTDGFVFTFPYGVHESNYRTHSFSDEFKGQAFVLRAAFRSQAVALLHGDLHTGSMMGNHSETYFIDTEFAYVGPMGFDVGLMLANLLMSSVSHAVSSADSDYQAWVLRTIDEFWSSFESQFLACWSACPSRDDVAVLGKGFEAHKREYLQQVFKDAVGFAGLEMCRRSVGIAGVTDVRELPDPSHRKAAEDLCLRIGEQLVEHHSEINNVKALTGIVERELSEVKKPLVVKDKAESRNAFLFAAAAFTVVCAVVIGRSPK